MAFRFMLLLAVTGGPGAAGKGGQAEQGDAGEDQRPAGGCEKSHHGLCGGDVAGGGSRLPVSVRAGSEGLRGAAEEAFYIIQSDLAGKDL